ncbi:hypothetical protein CHT98_28580 (plasmid) [Azospirillum brasilense]|uniref:Uncharacterized protein n=1 Tax=Azospirillum brasilense TaxID=192 RepID=A0A235H594_AZOBR|nr:hypothetical protein CHT98_28580 [Azospirillum brasilense]
MRKPPVNMAPWRLSEDEILAIARRKGRFEVPRYLWRADAMRTKCRQLCEAGALRRLRPRRVADTLVFVPTPAGAT